MFKGIYGDLKQDVDAPYMVCPVHTKEAWEKYQQTQQPTDPTDPADPTEPSDPGDSQDVFPWLNWSRKKRGSEMIWISYGLKC